MIKPLARDFKPKLKKEVTLIPVQEGVLIDGLSTREIIRGPVARTVLPKLLTFLDGNHSVEAILQNFDHGLHDLVRSAIEILFSWHLILQESDVSEPSLSFLLRLAFSSRVSSTQAALSSCLALANIVILTEASLKSWANSLSSQLKDAGFRSCKVYTSETFQVDQEPAPTLLVLVTMFEENSLAAVGELLRSNSNISWLRVAMSKDGHSADIGPLFKAQSTDCYQCFARFRMPSTIANAGIDEVQFKLPILMAFAALQIIYSISTPHIALGGRDLFRYDTVDWGVSRLLYAHFSDCPIAKWQNCKVHSSQEVLFVSHIKPLQTAMVYETYMAAESRTSSMGRYALDNIAATELTREHKKLINCPKIDLGSVRIAPAKRIFNRAIEGRRGVANISAEHLGATLAMAAGIQDVGLETPKRWAASAGNLGSPELFVIAESVTGMQEGGYFYQASDHSLARLSEGEVGWRDLIKRVSKVTPFRPSAVLVFTGAYHRLERKYGAFAYRLVQFDAGVAASQARSLLSFLGIESVVLDDFTGLPVEEALLLREFDEQLTLLLAIRSTPDPDVKTDGQADIGSNLPLQQQELHTVEWFSQLSIKDLTKQLYFESLYRTVQPIAEAFPKKIGPARRRVSLPVPNKRRLFDVSVFGKRKSVRDFNNLPIHIKPLCNVLNYAYSCDSTEFSSDCSNGLNLSFHVLVLNVAKLDRGIYLYQPETNHLEIIRDHLSLINFQELFLQPEFENAACVVWISGSLKRSLELYGSFGHRRLLRRTGSAGNHLWMEALSNDLSGTLVAGLVMAKSSELLSLSPYEELSMLAFVVGNEKK